MLLCLIFLCFMFFLFFFSCTVPCCPAYICVCFCIVLCMFDDSISGLLVSLTNNCPATTRPRLSVDITHLAATLLQLMQPTPQHFVFLLQLSKLLFHVLKLLLLLQPRQVTPVCCQLLFGHLTKLLVFSRLQTSPCFRHRPWRSTVKVAGWGQILETLHDVIEVLVHVRVVRWLH